MTHAQQVIDLVMASKRARESSVFSTRSYADEPLITTGSRMASYLPERYREMHAIAATHAARYWSEAQLFCAQGRFMADWEDNADLRVSFERYYPTYRMMNSRQLRAYFSWRTQVRRALKAAELEENVPAVPLSFAFVYVYELLNGIGTASPEEGLQTLGMFWRMYRGSFPEMRRHAPRWMRDLAVYHDIDPALLRRALGDSAQPSPADELSVLAEAESYADDELFQAICEVSSYRVERSRLYKDEPELFQRAACGAFRTLSAYFARHRTVPLADYLFGGRVTRPYTMFESAVFYAPVRHADAAYALSGTEQFLCERGSWRRVRFRRAAERSARLGALVKAVDARLREQLGAYDAIKPGSIAKYMAKMVDDAVEEALDWKRTHTVPKLELDRSKLAEIRVAAAGTCEALLTDEEREQSGGATGAGARSHARAFSLRCETARETPPPPGAEPFSTAEAKQSLARSCTRENVVSPANDPAQDHAAAPSLLSPAEKAYVRALLGGKDRSAAARAAKLPEDMLVDNINEKLFDLLGDTAIEYADGAPAVIEDYEDDVRGILTS